MTFTGSHFAGVGQCGHGLLLLMLTPGSESMAHAVRAKFGPSVQIQVGLTVWNGKPGRSPRCGSLPKASTTSSGYSALLDLKSTLIKSGTDLRGKVVLKNTTGQDVRVDTAQPIEVVLTRVHSRTVVGVFSGAISGTGFAPMLSPDHSINVEIVGGTARCDGGMGSALPPGHYDAMAEVSGAEVTGDGGLTAPPLVQFTSVEPVVITRS
jgi:hypothetical protein